MIEIKMPRLSDSMVEGVVVRWLKSKGDRVEVGDDLVEIETDKATMVYEADAAGALIEIVAKAGDTVPVGAVLAWVGEPGEAPPPAGAAGSLGFGRSDAIASSSSMGGEELAAVGGAQAESGSEALPRLPLALGDRDIRASPVARRLARASGIGLREIQGSGPGGRIVRADVEAALGAFATETTAGVSVPLGLDGAAPESAKGVASVVELTRLQKTVARRMAEAKATIPDFCISVEVDMTGAAEARRQLKRTSARDLVIPSLNDLIIKAAAVALREHPRANAAYMDGHYQLYPRVNVGVAVAAEDALVVPTVFDADTKGLREIAEETERLAVRVREGTITPPELAGGTFTVSNLGMLGIDRFVAVINPPQAAILAVGAVAERPVVKAGRIGCAELMTLTLSCDHRILYGADSARFLGRIRELLEHPLALVL